MPRNMWLVQVVSVPCSPMRLSCGHWGLRVRDVRVWAMVVMNLGMKIASRRSYVMHGKLYERGVCAVLLGSR